MARGWYFAAMLVLLSATAAAQPRNAPASPYSPEYKWRVQAAEDAVYLTLYRYPGKQCQCGPHEVWSTSWPGASNPQSQNLPSCERQGLPALGITLQLGDGGQLLDIYCADAPGSRPRLVVEKRAAKIDWLVRTGPHFAEFGAAHGAPIVRLQDGSESHCYFWRSPGNELVNVACPLQPQ